MKPPEFIDSYQLLAFGAAQCTETERQDAFAIARTVFEGYFAGIRSHQQLCAFLLALIARVAREFAAASTQREKGVPQ